MQQNILNSSSSIASPNTTSILNSPSTTSTTSTLNSPSTTSTLNSPSTTSLSSFSFTDPAEAARVLGSVRFSEPVQIQISTPTISNSNNYQSIGREFLLRYALTNFNGLTNIGTFYASNACITLLIHRSTNVETYECQGFPKFQSKMAELNVNQISYSQMSATNNDPRQFSITCQPVGRDMILITSATVANVGGIPRQLFNTFLVQFTNNSGSIINHVMDIFV